MIIFFLFAMLLGAALQITNAYGGAFLDDFKTTYADSFGVKHPNILIIYFADIRNAIYFNYPFLSAKIWYQDSDAVEHFCLGFTFWFIWY